MAHQKRLERLTGTLTVSCSAIELQVNSPSLFLGVRRGETMRKKPLPQFIY